MSLSPSLSYRLLRGDLSVVFYVSIAKLALHLIVNAMGGYGLFRDELYYLACANHLAAGYVDQPPLSILALRMMTTVFGDSLFAIRLLPAVLGACTVFITGLITIRLGGKTMAQIIACICAASPISNAMHSFYSMNSIDFLVWALTSYVILLIVQEGDKKYWIWLGVVLGVGLMNKIGVLFLGAGIVAGLLFTKERKWLLTPWPYVAGFIAFVFFMPYVVWNVQHDMAHLEFIRNASGGKYAGLSAIDFALGQVLLNNPMAILIWVPGLVMLFFYTPFKQYRWLGFLYAVPFLIFLVNGTSKAEYLAPAYCGLWAAGAIGVEYFSGFFRSHYMVSGVVAALVLMVAITLLPMTTPILPVETYIRYADALGFKPSSSESKELGELPQFYADMFGWKQKAVDVARAYNTLSGEDKKRCRIMGDNYGQCGAIDYYGASLGLPKSIGDHNNYWIWGHRGFTGEVLILMGGSYDDHVNDFEEVKLAAVSDCQYCMPYEDDLHIFICRGLKVPIDEVWGAEKKFE
ncbi:MAG TPA: glycosyltransferase family 39 protein [Ohtaekwangia sp.]|nr:glycosyltransferase family 39 protein [Ohtaekwangia sp.]